jgi:hypothetical protein
MVGMKRCGASLGAAVVLFCACSSTPPEGDTGLPEGSLLATLSVDDWRIACKSIDAAYTQRPEDTCARAGFVATRTPANANGSEADVRATCKSIYDTCMREARPLRASTCPTSPVGPMCGATVGEAEQCLMAILARRHQDIDSVPSCMVVTLAQATAAGTTAPITNDEIRALPACVVVDQKCHEFFP